MIYFISDVHLGIFERDKDITRENKLLLLLDKISLDAEKIYLVGDIFDYWFDYKQVIPKYFYRTLAKLQHIKSNICDIEYLMGNHDFGHNGFFENEIKIKVFCEDIVRDHNNRKFYITHGDGKDKRDIGYLALKKVLRNRFSLWLYLKFHPNFGIGIASGSSKKSRKYTDKKHFAEGDAMFDFAKMKIDEGYDYVIMGHRHKVGIQTYNNGVYLNIGDWINSPTIACYDNNNLYHIYVDEYLKNGAY